MRPGLAPGIPQDRAALSADPDTRILPVEAQAADVTVAVCPSRVATDLPVAASHSPGDLAVPTPITIGRFAAHMSCSDSPTVMVRTLAAFSNCQCVTCPPSRANR